MDLGSAVLTRVRLRFQMAGLSWDQLELTQLRWVWKDLTGLGFARFG